MKIKPLTLHIEKELWDEFKSLVPSSMTLNEAVIDLIADKVKEEKEVI